jgi:hypothetical protein
VRQAGLALPFLFRPFLALVPGLVSPAHAAPAACRRPSCARRSFSTVRDSVKSWLTKGEPVGPVRPAALRAPAGPALAATSIAVLPASMRPHRRAAAGRRGRSRGIARSNTSPFSCPSPGFPFGAGSAFSTVRDSVESWLTEGEPVGPIGPAALRAPAGPSLAATSITVPTRSTSARRRAPRTKPRIRPRSSPWRSALGRHERSEARGSSPRPRPSDLASDRRRPADCSPGPLFPVVLSLSRRRFAPVPSRRRPRLFHHPQACQITVKKMLNRVVPDVPASRPRGGGQRVLD